MAEHEKKDPGSTNITMLSHNKVGDVFVAIAPALNGWALFTIALVTLFIGIYWWAHPHGFIDLVVASINTVAGFLNIILWLAIATIGGLILNKLFLPLLHSIIAIFRPAPTIHAFNEHFAIYSGGGVQVHDHQEARHLPESPAPLQLPPAPPAAIVTPEVPVPTGRELLMSGAVSEALTQGLIILGPGADGKLKTLKIKKCFSTLVSGLPSSGKTTTVFWISSQLVLIGAGLWIVDPHLNFCDEDGNRSLAKELEALSESFVFAPCDGEADQVIDRVRWMYAELVRRQRPGYIVRADQTVIAIMDEFNTIADSIDPKQVIVLHNGRSLNFSSTLALLEREGRKYGLHFILIGHKWTQRDIGGDNALRTNATTYMCHRMNDKHQAELLISGGGKEVLALNSGSYWITGISWNSEPARITTPMISAADIPLLLQVKQRGLVEVVNMGNVVDADPVPDYFPTTSQMVPKPDDKHDNGNGGNTGGKQSELDSVKLALVRQMVQEHKSQNEIVTQVFPGMRNADAIAEYRKYLSDLVEG